MYEAFGGHARATVAIGDHFSGRVVRVVVTNLLEDEEEDEEVQILDENDLGPVLKLDFRGFEVKTLKLTLQEKASIRTQQTSQKIKKVWVQSQLTLGYFGVYDAVTFSTRRSSWVDIDGSRLVTRED